MTLRVSAGVSVLPSAANDRLPADLDDIQTVSWWVLSQLLLFEEASAVTLLPLVTPAQEPALASNRWWRSALSFTDHLLKHKSLLR